MQITCSKCTFTLVFSISLLLPHYHQQFHNFTTLHVLSTIAFISKFHEYLISLFFKCYLHCHMFRHYVPVRGSVWGRCNHSLECYQQGPPSETLGAVLQLWTCSTALCASGVGWQTREPQGCTSWVDQTRQGLQLSYNNIITIIVR